MRPKHTDLSRTATGMRPALGLTLIEVLVALGMVALALAAGLTLNASLVRRAEREPAMLLADICARNHLAGLQLSDALPPLGQAQHGCVQAGRTLRLSTEVTPAPGTELRQVFLRVHDSTLTETALLQLATVVGPR